MFEQILSLPIEKKIGQLFFIGLSGAELDESSSELLKEISPGGVCLFARNIREAAQTRQLLDGVRENLSIKPFLSVDQEGKLVDRLRRIVEPMPGAGSLKTAEDAGRLAEITAETIRILGFNMNFAPVVDVINEERAKANNGLYSRAFGNSKEEAAEYALVYLEKLEKNGCLGCLKHFPGLGASEVDSHEELPQVLLSQNELFETDLFPYREIFKTIKTNAVMIAHASYPESDLQEIDRDGKLLPSSLSFNFTTKLLREELGFRGIAVTDDLEMGAILKNYGIGEACKMAIRAGADMLAICAKEENIREGFKTVFDAAASGEISETRIDESLKRIVGVKNLINSPLPFDENRLRELSGEIVELKERINL
jgi:beta-N-acetylhexosaminidase